MSSDRKRLSKFLAVMLRHKPEQFGLTLDAHGFAPLEPVWQAIRDKYGGRYTYDDLEAVVAGDATGKKRYEIIGDRIRAMYGHSHVREIVYPPVQPPQTLFHGTNATAAAAIRQQGLMALGRQYVHLTTNRTNALNVARRRTPAPVLLVVQAQAAHAAGYVFHQPEAEHYLTRQVPPSFITFPDD